jgi:hypothetical protein
LMDVLPREAARRAADMAFADDTGATAGLIERILGLPPAAPPAAPAAAHD